MNENHFDQLWLKSNVFPAGTLLDSYYDRQVTQLSDRGLASNMIGDRWSDVSAKHIGKWRGTTVLLPDGLSPAVSHVYRLDSTPQIASAASRRKLQNPDFVVAGELDGEKVLFAIDAKFSIDTAKSAQVSAKTLESLIDVGPLITDWLTDLPTDTIMLDGYFVSPDMLLSHYVLGRRRGRFSTQISSDRVMLIPVQPVPFLKPLSGARLIGTLATVDGYREEIRSNMHLAMYYFRLVRACYGAYAETTMPIFAPRDSQVGSDVELEQRTVEIARGARRAWDMVLQWDASADQIRRQRETAYTAMAFPLANRDIRDRVVAESEIRNLQAPSVNSVRKRMGSWYRSQFDDRLGSVLPPVHDLPSLLQDIHQIAAELEPTVFAALDDIIEEVFANQLVLSDGNAETV